MAISSWGIAGGKCQLVVDVNNKQETDLTKQLQTDIIKVFHCINIVKVEPN